MTALRSMTALIRASIALAGCTILAFASSLASAAQFQIDATGTYLDNNGNIVSTTNWTLVFDDTSGDGLLQVDEIVSFSGTTVTTNIATYNYDAIVGTPDIAGISTQSGTFNACCWWLSGPATDGPQDGWYPYRWIYALSRYSVPPPNATHEVTYSGTVTSVTGPEFSQYAVGDPISGKMWIDASGNLPDLNPDPNRADYQNFTNFVTSDAPVDFDGPSADLVVLLDEFLSAGTTYDSLEITDTGRNLDGSFPRVTLNATSSTEDFINTLSLDQDLELNSGFSGLAFRGFWISGLSNMNRVFFSLNHLRWSPLVSDADADGVADQNDLCPDSPSEPVDASGCSDTQVDGDGDGFCNILAPSAGPSVCLSTDNCPTIFNPDQTDMNGDGFGDACVPPGAIPPGMDIGTNPVIGAGTTIASGTSIGDNANVGENTAIAKDSDIGNDLTVGRNSEIAKDNTIGDGVTIGDDVFLDKDVQIGDGTQIGDRTIINKGVVIGSNVMIGADVVIAKETIIPDNTVIPDGASVPPVP